MGIDNLADFHFIRPYWLFAISGLLLALYLLKKMRVKQSGWQGLLPKHLANVLIDKGNASKPLSLVLPFLIGLLAIIAMAGPSWKKLPQPVYQVARGSVLIMDMSYSMYSTDLSPNRLTRARYKAIDLLDNLNEGEMGLIAYAGDAFVISPLTEDINNIKLLLPSLSPDLMPELGSDPLRALTLAHDMLTNAGHIDGDIYWFTDGIENSDVQDITEWTREHPYKLNILGVGTKTGAPIKLSNGEFMKENNGSIVVPKLTESALKGSAKRGGGVYVQLQNNSDDITAILKSTSLSSEGQEKQQDTTNIGDQWEEAGPYLIICLLPFVLAYFRRGKLLAIIPVFFLMTPNNNAYANVWNDLWKTTDQQAQQKFNQEDYKAAADQFNDPLWQGSSHYKAGNFEEALKSFQQSNTANALYNQGNSLAKLNKLDEAINAYDKALEKNPNLESAKANKNLLEELKKQQEQQNSDQNQKGENQDGEQDQQDQENENSQENDQGQQGDSEQNQNSDQENQSSEQNNEQEGEQQSNQSENEDQSENNSEQQSEQAQETENEESEQEQQASATQESETDENLTEEQKAQAMRAAEKLAQETDQKHQQLLNKVTDDPYQLLRNKMKIEYKKRRQNRNSLGATKKW
jgi:Ca-activated chloride channel family protein